MLQHFALSAEQEDMGFFASLWNYLYEAYLSVDGNYQNLGADKSPLFSLRLTVLGIFIGTVIACIAMAYHKQVLGGAVRKLITEKATSPESAKTLEELGYKKNFILRNAFARSTSLRRFVKCVGEEEFYREQNEKREEHEKKRENDKSLAKFKELEYLVDVSSDKFYVPEDARVRAEVRFEKKGSGVLSTIISIIVLIALFIALLFLLPLIFGAIDSFVGGFKK